MAGGAGHLEGCFVELSFDRGLADALPHLEGLEPFRGGASVSGMWRGFMWPGLRGAGEHQCGGEQQWGAGGGECTSRRRGRVAKGGATAPFCPKQ